MSLESSVHGLFGDIFSFKIKVGICEKLGKSNDCSTTKQMRTATQMLLPLVDGGCRR